VVLVVAHHVELARLGVVAGESSHRERQVLRIRAAQLAQRLGAQRRVVGAELRLELGIEAARADLLLRQLKRALEALGLRGARELPALRIERAVGTEERVALERGLGLGGAHGDPHPLRLEHEQVQPDERLQHLSPEHVLVLGGSLGAAGRELLLGHRQPAIVFIAAHAPRAHGGDGHRLRRGRLGTRSRRRLRVRRESREDDQHQPEPQDPRASVHRPCSPLWAYDILRLTLRHRHP